MLAWPPPVSFTSWLIRNKNEFDLLSHGVTVVLFNRTESPGIVRKHETKTHDNWIHERRLCISDVRIRTERLSTLVRNEPVDPRVFLERETQYADKKQGGLSESLWVAHTRDFNRLQSWSRENCVCVWAWERGERFLFKLDRLVIALFFLLFFFLASTPKRKCTRVRSSIHRRVQTSERRGEKTALTIYIFQLQPTEKEKKISCKGTMQQGNGKSKRIFVWQSWPYNQVLAITILNPPPRCAQEKKKKLLNSIHHE